MRRNLLAFLVVALCGAAPAAAHAYPAGRLVLDPGVSATSIRLGSVIDQTGPGTVISTHILAGYRLAIQEANAQGGVNGRKIDFTALSDNYDPSQTLPQVKQLVESDGVFAILGVFGTDDARVAVPYTEQHQVPLFDPIGGGVGISGKKWVWQTEPDYGREGRVIARYAAVTLHAKRVAVLYQSGIGEPQRDALKSTLPKYRASLVDAESYGATDSNLNGQVLRLRSANPDVIVLNGTPGPTAAFMHYAALLGYRPKDGFIANYPMGDPLWISLVNQSAAEGVLVSSYADLTGKNSEARAYRKAIARFHAETYSNYGLYGYFNAGLLIRALRLTGKQPTRSRLQAALDTKFRHLNTGFAGTLTWTATQRFGARDFKIYRIHNGSFVPVTGWLKP